jgi:pyrimidine operon attenuation protein/uracil phosphoribosyltransferase
MKKHLILNHQDIKARIKRIAFQIYEAFAAEETLVIVGIANKGMALAEKIVADLNEISPLNIQLVRLEIDKTTPENTITTSVALKELEGKSIVIVDDVLYTGKTLVYAVAHILQTPVKKMKTAVLVNRNYKLYPIKGDFKGISLSTSLKEHVEVVLEESEMAAYLTE